MFLGVLVTHLTVATTNYPTGVTRVQSNMVGGHGEELETVNRTHPQSESRGNCMLFQGSLHPFSLTLALRKLPPTIKLGLLDSVNLIYMVLIGT